MGTISNALYKYKEETVVNLEFVSKTPPQPIVRHEPRGSFSVNLAPHIEGNPKLVVIAAPDSAEAENFRLLRAQVLFPKHTARPRTIMVTSALPDEGKTLVMANLAASIALGIEEYVLAVDCDLRQPSMHNLFGYSNAEGLHEHLGRRKRLEELIISTNVDKLSLLTAGNAPPNPTELLSSSIMEEFLEEVKGRYPDRFIVIDSSPSNIAAETSALARHVDGIILVVRAHKTPRKAVKKTIQALGKEKVLGVVFNGYSKSEANYHTYYGKNGRAN
jgi:protein-tyrosine kinase